MKKFFPLKQILGFVFSLVLTAIALFAYYTGMSFGAALTVLIITAFAQASLQLIVFMHAGETDDKKMIYTKIIFMMVIALITIFGSLFLLVWDM